MNPFEVPETFDTYEDAYFYILERIGEYYYNYDIDSMIDDLTYNGDDGKLHVYSVYEFDRILCLARIWDKIGLG